MRNPGGPPDRAAGARTRQPENSKRAHLSAPALQTPPKFNEKTPQRDRERAKRWWEREEKREMLGGPSGGGSSGGGVRRKVVQGSPNQQQHNNHNHNNAKPNTSGAPKGRPALPSKVGFVCSGVGHNNTRQHNNNTTTQQHTTTTNNNTTTQQQQQQQQHNNNTTTTQQQQQQQQHNAAPPQCSPGSSLSVNSLFAAFSASTAHGDRPHGHGAYLRRSFR